MDALYFYVGHHFLGLNVIKRFPQESKKVKDMGKVRLKSSPFESPKHQWPRGP